jgi:hypothetical protein
VALKTIVENALTVGVAIFFFYMGLGALIDPNTTLSYFSAGPLGPDMRNEVRAVYGGYGIAICLLLLATLWISSIKTGARLAVLVSVGGMAGGRILSMMMETPAGEFPLTILIVEIVLVAMLAGALTLQGRQSVWS